MGFLRDCFTGADQKTYDIGRVLWFESVNAYILISGYMVWKGTDLDMFAWGGGLAALMGAGGAALGLKANTEPRERRGGPPMPYMPSPPEPDYYTEFDHDPRQPRRGPANPNAEQ